MSAHDATAVCDKWARMCDYAIRLRSQALCAENEFQAMAHQAALTGTMFSPDAMPTAALAAKRVQKAMLYLQMVKLHINVDPLSAVVSVALLAVEADLKRTQLMLG